VCWDRLTLDSALTDTEGNDIDLDKVIEVHYHCLED
jgi:hypothetical protein